MNITKYAKFIIKLLSARITNSRVPLIIILCVTNKCNLNCWYCYGEHPYRNKWPDFTTEEILSIIYQLHKLGTQILQLQGGEPLLRDDLNVIINEAHKYGMICDMVTNGILIPQKKKIVSLLDKICISLDGPPTVNDENRGAGSFNRIIKGIEVACGLKLSIRISAVLTSKTKKEDIDWLINFAYKHKVLVNFSPSFQFIPQIRDNSFKPHNIPDENLRSIFEYIKIAIEKGSPIQFSPESYSIASNWPFTYEKRMANSKEIPLNFYHPNCYHGTYIFFIDSDGSVYPCCNFWGESTYNIRIHSIKESILGVDRNDCTACYIPAYIDRNLFFNGRPNTWRNYITQVLKGVL